MKPIPPTLTLPPRTLSGPGTLTDLLDDCLEFGPRGIIACGESLRKSGRLDTLLADRSRDEILVHVHPGGEPTLAQVEALRDAARKHEPDWVLGVGGGSVLDASKAATGLLGAPLPLVDYHNGAAIPASHTPYLAAPTTAGTGSEATTVCVLTNTDTGVKKSIRHASFMARSVCLDPRMLASCPARIIAWSGMDAFAQAVESYCSRNATWVTDELALKSAVLVRRHLPAAHAGGTDDNRYGVLLGSYLSGLALSNARLGLVHGLAHPLGARYHLAHGLVCGVCLPSVLRFNRETLGARYALLAEALGEDPIACTERLLAELDVTSPFNGLELADEDGILRETLASGSTAANPRDVSDSDAREILQRLFS